MDGDGWSCAAGDCNDGVNSIYPGAPDPCDGVDQDCDGADGAAPDGDGDFYGSDCDCDDGDITIHPGATEIPDDGIDQDCDGSDAVTCFEDLDGDGYGSTVTVINPAGNCTDPGYSSDDTDCDDGDASVHPGATEIPDDAIDQDCDGSDAVTCFEDLDGDGYGSTVTVFNPAGNCTDPGYSTLDNDCDDGDANVYPGASEYCNGVDDDCDLVVDNDYALDAVAWYIDRDGDGYGWAPSVVIQCDPPDPTWVLNGDDCHDLQVSVNPGGTETCNGLDDDCNGTPDDLWTHSDGDSFGDDCDNCPYDDNPQQREYPREYPMKDGVGTYCDNCPGLFNPAQLDNDGDGIGNPCEFMTPFMATGASPVSLVVITPDGDSIGPGFNTIGWHASYEESVDYTGDGDPDDRVVIRFSLNGDFVVRVHPRPEALPGDTYTLMSVQGNGTEVNIIQDEPVPPPGEAHGFLHTFFCACPCHADPQCDGFTNVLDVVRAVDVGFRGATPGQDPDCSKEQTDVNCDGYTNVIDVVKFINVAFRGSDPADQFCDPCPAP